MAISLISIEPRGLRRVRCVFSNTLAAGAFVASKYALTSNGVGVAPGVAAAIIVAASAAHVELTLDSDFVQGGSYTLTCTAVPAADASTFTGSQSFYYGDTRAPENVERKQFDSTVALFGRDLIWNGLDYVEAITGDLETIEGEKNAEGAIERRLHASGLLWDRNYGAYADDFVDAPSGEASTLHGALVRQVMLDDRAEDVEATFEIQEDGRVFFRVLPRLRGGITAKPVTLRVDE